MPSSIRPDLLLSRLQLRAPSARSILFTSPRGGLPVSRLAAELSAAIVLAGNRARLLDVTSTSSDMPAVDGVERLEVLESELSAPDRARRALQWGEGFTVVCTEGVLESASAIMLAAAADAVVLVARQGHTTRPDLVRARAELETGGGTVVGSVLLD